MEDPACVDGGMSHLSLKEGCGIVGLSAMVSIAVAAEVVEESVLCLVGGWSRILSSGASDEVVNARWRCVSFDSHLYHGSWGTASTMTP